MKSLLRLYLSLCALYRENPLALFHLIFIEILFVFVYILLKGGVNIHLGIMPVWLAYFFVLITFIDAWAVWYKLKAILFYSKRKRSKFSMNFYLLCFFSLIRLVVFSFILLLSWATIQHRPATDSMMNVVLGLVFLKELFVFFILLTAKKSQPNVHNKPNFWFICLSDIIIVFTAQYVVLLLDDLFNVPMFDLSFNFLFLIFLVLLCILLYLAFFLPFRFLYYVKSSSRTDLAMQLDFGSIAIILISQFSLLFYSSESASEHFLNAINEDNWSTGDEFSYVHNKRLKGKTLERLCDIENLRRLEFSTKYTGYLPDCIFEMKSLQEINLENNRFSILHLARSKTLKVANLSKNDIPSIWKIGFFKKDNPSTIEVLDLSYNGIKEIYIEDLKYYPELRWLDLSYNPIEKISIDQQTLSRLDYLGLKGTRLSDADLAALKNASPGLNLETE